MIGQLIGPLANLAGNYLQGKADKASANAKLKLVEAESKAAILMSKETSTADWERIMAESTKKELNMLAEGITSETIFNEAIDLARKGRSVEEIVAQTKLSKDQAETIVRFHGSKNQKFYYL